MKRISLNKKILKYLVIFSIAILFILWAFQIMYLSFFYEKYKTNNINTVLDYITLEQAKDLNNIESKAYEYGLCIEIIDNQLNSTGSITFNPLYKGCLLRNNKNKSINDIKVRMFNSETKVNKYNLIDPEYDSKSLLYGIRLDDGRYVYLNTTLENIESTSQTLQSQMKYVTLIVMTVSAFIAYFVSKSLTKPIVKLTQKAVLLGSGNLDVEFDKSNIQELDELSSALNIASKELRNTDELRRDLMANVSHDLKTPLTMIKAYAEMVKDLSYSNKEKREEHLDIIINETERLNILVNDILELSKMQCKTQDLEITEFDIVQEIQSIIKSYSIIKETLNYEFIVDVPEKCIVKGDRKKLNRVIYNLINNAINYTGSDNKVFVTLIEDKKTITINIKDTGKGIKPEDIDNIWNRYYKKEKNHRRNVVGTGLGLAIVKEVLEAHKFKYGINTKINQGTEFYFTINKKNSQSIHSNFKNKLYY